MLNKLSDILEKMANDSDTHVTVIITNDAHFCQGIDLTELALGAVEKRKNVVKNLCSAVKRYLVTLASYPKPLIAGVNGHVMNLGLMQLIFFDIVVAGDKCTYETTYTKMGQLPESYGVWNKLNKIRGSFKTKLFWLGEKVQSTEAALAGLVNKLTTGTKVNEEAINVARKMASMPPESYRSMKNTVTQCYLGAIEETFDEEFTTIAEQWTSSECLEQIKKITEQGHF
ncbi:enoyl-CoA delta isomerase 2-like, partial [Musca vetustissima]